MESLQHRILFDRSYSWVLHIAFWLFVYLDLLVDIEYLADYWSEFLIAAFFDMVIVYFNIYYLLPKFLLKKKYLWYASTTLGCVIFLMMVNYFLTEPFEEEYSIYDKVIYHVEILVFNGFILGSAIGLKLFKTLVRNRMKLDELRNLQSEVELNNLKNQINPHFLFNTMNSMYVMAQKGDENLPGTILDLSDLMRFQLHKGDKRSITISDEFNFIKNYIKFEQLRRDDMTVEITEELYDGSVHVPPLILLCFVENAMKHCRSMDNSPSIVNLSLISDIEMIRFTIYNTKGDFEKRLNNTDHGIGEANVKRRLDIMYESEYSLNISDTEETYKVSLDIPTQIRHEAS